MSSRQPSRTPPPPQRTKDPPDQVRQSKRQDKQRSTTWKSYAAAVATSLISPEKLIREHSEREKTPESSETVWTPQVSHFRPFKRGIEPHTVFYDVTDIGNCPNEFYSALNATISSDQHLGAKYHKENKRTLIEIVCDSDATCQTLVDTGLTVKESVLYPVKSLTQEAEVVTVMLSNLPFINKLELQKGLMSIMSAFGQVLDVLLFTDPKNGIFFGNGMAVLNTTPPAEVLTQPDYDPRKPYYTSLSHNIDFMGRRRFHATWRNMPSYCIYCHDPDHIIQDCPERPVIKCWNCGGEGHFKSDCTFNKSNNGRKKAKTHHRKPNDDEFSDNDTFEQNAIALTEEAEQRLNGTNHKEAVNDLESEEMDENSPTNSKRGSTISIRSSVLDEEDLEEGTNKELEDMEIDDNDDTTPPSGPVNQHEAPNTLNMGEPTQTSTKKPAATSKTSKIPKAPTTPRPRPQGTSHRMNTRSRTLPARAQAQQEARTRALQEEQAYLAEQRRLAQSARGGHTNTNPQSSQH